MIFLAPAGPISIHKSEIQKRITMSAAGKPMKLTLPQKAAALVEERLDLQVEFMRLEEERTQLAQVPELPEWATAELRRQSREIRQMPAASVAQAGLEKSAASADAGPEPAADDSPEARVRAMAVRQWRAIVRWWEGIPALHEAMIPMMADEPLRAMFQNFNIQADKMFAWTVYGAALEDALSENQAAAHDADAAIAELDAAPKGVLGRSGDEERAVKAERARLAQEGARAADRARRIERELAAISPLMVETFWESYREAACLMAAVRLPHEQPDLRAFLRYGAVCRAPWFLGPEAQRRMFAECAAAIPPWDYRTEADHVMYMDEYLWYASHSVITPSVDESLNIERRHTPEWEADKAFRRIVHTQHHAAGLRELVESLAQMAENLRRKNTQLEAARNSLARSQPDFRKQHELLSDAVQSCRVSVGRLARAIERIKDTHLPEAVAVGEKAAARLAETGREIKPTDIAAHEAVEVRRICRLSAHLREHFAPLVLRRLFHAGADMVDRNRLCSALAEIEHADTTVFKDVVVAAPKRSDRIYMRVHPIAVILPVCGTSGVSMNPRGGPEIGRIAFPCFTPRHGMFTSILQQVMADFRWDTSQAASGIDLMASDTLAGEYSTVRWNFRRLPREAREKAAVYKEESHRKNWRRHYALFITSAHDGGKSLFFKCPEAYDVLIRHIGLPEGVDRLHK
jgi:hypothetical protein